MNYLRHPYLLSIIGVIVLLVVGTVIVDAHLPVTVIDRTRDWGGPIVFSARDPVSYAPDVSSARSAVHEGATDVLTVQNPASFSYMPDPGISTAAAIADTIIGTDTAFDFGAFIQQLSRPSSKIPGTSQIDLAILVDGQTTYPTVPVQSFDASDRAAPARSDTQQSLYAYGNEAGSHIRFYEQTHPNDGAIIEGFFKTRNTKSAAALKQLGTDIKNIGINLQTMTNVPASATSAHRAFAESYIEVGDKLTSLLSAQTDAAVIGAIDVYDDAVQTHIRNYIAVIDLFSRNGVTFQQDEQGRVFVFTPMQ